jgi:tetratricopeptide (TPR) repeat protein
MISSRAMSDAFSKTAVSRHAALLRSIPIVLVAMACASCSKESAARRTLAQGMALYNEGKYAEALPVLQKARESGLKDGTLLYQLGFCREVVEHSPEPRRETWREAEPLLAQEIVQTGGATLERLYYLTVIHSDTDRFDDMTKYARQAVEQFEKGPNPNGLGGEDWFRLGRLHDFLSEASLAEAAYRRSVSAFSKAKGGAASYRSLALARVADYDLAAGHFPNAAEEFDEALKLYPPNNQIRPFHHALALLAVHRYEDAIARFGEDKGETSTESQYGGDLAKKAKAVEPLDDKDVDGSLIQRLPDEVLAARVKETAKDFRAARVKNSYQPGDSLPAEVALHQKRFVALLIEYFLRMRAMQEFTLKEGIADLVRR